MNSIDTLSEIFARFPGIGPRQAKRFVYYLLSRDKSATDALVKAVENLKNETLQCTECQRFFAKNGDINNICRTCADTERDASLLMIVPRDADYEALEKSGSFKGYYFVLGGSVPILEKEPEQRIRIKQLEARMKRDKDKIKEVVLAMNANAEGENTAIFIKEKFKDVGFSFSELGRGLSTGAELEYADPDTLKNALKNRSK